MRSLLNLSFVVLAVGFAAAGSTRPARDPSAAAPETAPNATRDAIPLFRAHLATARDTMDILMYRRMLAVALLQNGAPIDEFARSADTLLTVLGPRKRMAFAFLMEASGRLMERPHGLGLAREYVTHAKGVGGNAQERAQWRRRHAGIEARWALANDRPREALAWFDSLGSDRDRSSRDLVLVGMASERVGEMQRAYTVYLTAATRYRDADTSGLAGLRRVYAARPGSVQDLEQAIAEARAREREHTLFAIHRVDQPAPPWTLPDLDGKSLSLASLKGRPVVIDFWGTWCGPCRGWSPVFEKLRVRYQRHAEFLSIAVEADSGFATQAAAVREYLDNHPSGARALLDVEHEVSRAHAIQAFPTTVIVDRQGVVRFATAGADSEAVALQIERVLAK